MSRLPTGKILAVRDINETPLIPSYYNNFGRQTVLCPPGRKNYQVGNKWMPCKRVLDTKNNKIKSAYGRKKRKRMRKKTKSTSITDKHIRSMAKRLKVKMSSSGKRKSTRRLWGDVARKGKAILKSKKKGPLYSYMIKHCKMMAKKLKIKHTGKLHVVVWGQISKKALKSSTKKVTKRRKGLKKRKSKTKVRRGRKRYNRKNRFGLGFYDDEYCQGEDCNTGFFRSQGSWNPMTWPYKQMLTSQFYLPHPKGPLGKPLTEGMLYASSYLLPGSLGKPMRHTMKNPNKFGDNYFGSWWDNTQQDYANGCASQQCADAPTLGGNYPFYDKTGWKPYTPIKSSAYGRRRRKKKSSFGDVYEYADGYGMPGYMPNAYEPEFRKYSYEADIPKMPQTSWYSNLGKYPKDISSPYPFKMSPKKW